MDAKDLYVLLTSGRDKFKWDPFSTVEIEKAIETFLDDNLMFPNGITKIDYKDDIYTNMLPFIHLIQENAFMTGYKTALDLTVKV